MLNLSYIRNRHWEIDSLFISFIVAAFCLTGGINWYMRYSFNQQNIELLQEFSQLDNMIHELSNCDKKYQEIIAMNKRYALMLRSQAMMAQLLTHVVLVFDDSSLKTICYEQNTCRIKGIAHNNADHALTNKISRLQKEINITVLNKRDDAIDDYKKRFEITLFLRNRERG